MVQLNFFFILVACLMGISRILSKSNKFFRILSCFLKDPQGSQKKFESIGINNDFFGILSKICRNFFKETKIYLNFQELSSISLLSFNLSELEQQNNYYGDVMVKNEYIYRNWSSY